MSHDLDDMLARLARDPIDRRVANLEPAVWARLAVVPAPAPLGWRAGGAALALALGVVIGGAGASATIADPMTAFSAQTALAPSTLLEGRR